MKLKTKAALAAVAALAVSLSACGGGGGSPQPQGSVANQSQQAAAAAQYNPQPRDNIKDGGSLTTSVAEITKQFNTFEVDGTAYTLSFWRWYNPVMVLFDPDGTPKPNPDYLTDIKVEQKDGNTVATYTINPKAMYNNGDPIDWKSFEATWKANSGQNKAYLPSSTDGYKRVKSVTQGSDSRQAIVTFDGTYAWIYGLFNNILNPKALDPDVYNKGYVGKPHPEWGAGPYTIADDGYDAKNGILTFTKNDKWWGDPGKLDTRVFKAQESTASLNAFKNGEIDATSVASKDRLDQVKNMQDINILRSGTPSQSLVELNATRPQLKDPEVRKAILMGIDRKTLGNIEFNGLDYTEDPPGSFNLFGFQPGYADNFAAAGYKYDAAAANAALDQAGWAKGSDGIREKDGTKLSITYATIGDDPTTAAEAQAMVQMEKAIGVELKIDNHPSSEFSDVFTKAQWDFFSLSFASSDPFGFAYFCQLYCPDQGLNLSGTPTKAQADEIAKVAEIGDPQEQIKAGNELETKLIGETWGMLPLFNGPTIVAAKKGLANYGASLFYVGKPQDVGWQK